MITKLRKFLEKKDQTKAFEKYAETFRPHPSQIWASFFYEGYSQNYDRTREVIEAMVECVEGLETAIKHMEFCDSMDANKTNSPTLEIFCKPALANLREKLEKAQPNELIPK